MKHQLNFGSLLVAASMILAACGGAAAPTTAPTTAPTQGTEATATTGTAAEATATTGTAAEATATTGTEATTAPEATATTAAGAEATATTGTTGGKETKITIWHQWDGKYLDAITQVFKDYEASHPGVKIDISKPEDVA